MVEAVACGHVPVPPFRYYAQRWFPGFGPTLLFDLHQVIERLDDGPNVGSYVDFTLDPISFVLPSRA
jgi:hypothetical protein